MIIPNWRIMFILILLSGLALGRPGTAPAASSLSQSATTATTSSTAPAPAPTGDYKLVWSDEFNTDGAPDPANWDYERGFERNNELQWYQPENAVCKNGILVIEAKREHKPNPNYRPDGYGWRNRKFIDYTSACLITRGKREFTYGKFEMRARIDVRAGSWPAFWALGLNKTRRVGWPNCGEIDIMEYYRGDVLANVLYGRSGRQVWSTIKTPYAKLGGEAWAKEFHTWTMDWDDKKVDLLLDGKLLNHFDVAKADVPGQANPFHGPWYFLLNQAIGGTNGGDPSKTEFPVRFEVDYVRVFQRQ